MPSYADLDALCAAVGRRLTDDVRAAFVAACGAGPYYRNHLGRLGELLREHDAERDQQARATQRAKQAHRDEQRWAAGENLTVTARRMALADRYDTELREARRMLFGDEQAPRPVNLAAYPDPDDWLRAGLAEAAVWLGQELVAPAPRSAPTTRKLGMVSDPVSRAAEVAEVARALTLLNSGWPEHFPTTVSADAVAANARVDCLEVRPTSPSWAILRTRLYLEPCTR
jgi:hypothetical protein